MFKKKTVQTSDKNKNTGFKTLILKLRSSKYVYCLFFFFLKPFKLKKSRHRRRVCAERVPDLSGRGGASVRDLWREREGGVASPFGSQHSLCFDTTHRRLHHFLRVGLHSCPTSACIATADTLRTQVTHQHHHVHGLGGGGG